MKCFIRPITLAWLVFCLPEAYAQAETKPLWEAGAGVAAINFPIYRGADERRSYFLPIPYVVYNGDVLKVNRDRMRGLIFRQGRLEMDISINGSVPVKSKDTLARQGMPDLDAMLEIGPSLNVHLYYSEEKKINFDMRMPIRSATATNLKYFQHVGWLFQPQLNLDLRDIDHDGLNIGLAGGLLFSDRGYQQHFYNVAPQYATAVRPAYTTGGGYSGAQATLSLNQRQDGRWMGAFVKWDGLNGAVFANSPLVKKSQNFTLGFAATWVIGKSDKTVEVSSD